MRIEDCGLRIPAGASINVTIRIPHSAFRIPHSAFRIGERLASPADAARPWKATLRGGIVLELSYLLPVLGWFVILPLSIIIGCGAATLSLINLWRLPSGAASGSVSGAQVSGHGA